jgi:lactate dehydrogenase-like 2-hydroxyacid dehydrogenase
MAPAGSIMLFPVLLTRRIPEAGLTLLRSRCDCDVFDEDSPMPREQLLARVRGKRGLLCLLTDTIDAAVMDAAAADASVADAAAAGGAPGLAVISAYAVGYNNIDIAASRARGIAVTNTPGVLTDATADIAFILLQDCARRIAESDRWLRGNAFTGWSPTLFLGLDLTEQTLGIVGAGRIGEAVARRAHGAYRMRVLYSDAARNEALERDCAAQRVPLEALLAEADFISLHVPLTADTRHLIDARAFARMKSTAVLVNTSRGPVVDETALIDALRSRRIFAAGLDVYENEPAVPDELKQLDNVVILPHIGSASVSTRNRMATMAAQNLLDVLEGREPAHRVA